MAILKYPERLLQPFPSLNRFAQELYAMFRVAGDGQPGDDVVPVPAEQQRGQRLERPSDRVAEIVARTDSLFDRSEASVRAGDLVAEGQKRREEAQPRRAEPPRPKAFETVVEERRRAAAESATFPEPARRRASDPPRAEPERRRDAGLPDAEPSRRREPAEIPAPPARRSRDIPDPPARRPRESPVAPGNRDRKESPAPQEYRRSDRTPPAESATRPRREVQLPDFPAVRETPELPELPDAARSRSKREPFPDLPELTGIFPTLGGGSGTNVFIGQVVSHTSGEPAKVKLFPDGPEADTFEGTVDVKVPMLADGEYLDPDTWLFNVFQFSDGDGNDTYYAQPPIWM